MVIQKRTYSYDDYVKFQDLPENEGRIFELIEGEIVEKMPSFEPSEIAITIGYYCKGYLIQNPIGRLSGADGGYIMSDEDTFNPDIGYISKKRMPEKPSREAPMPPDFAVEVKSPTDSKRKMRHKAEKYLAYGTQLVWLVFPDEQAIEVYVPDEDVKTVTIEGILDGYDVLPGFILAVKDIFT
jgi:Uma2 family endonuclease